LHRAIETGALAPGIACDDGVAACFRDRVLAEVVTERGGGRCCALRIVDGRMEEIELATRQFDA